MKSRLLLTALALVLAAPLAGFLIEDILSDV